MTSNKPIMFPVWNNEKWIVATKPREGLPVPRIGIEEWLDGDDNWYYVDANDNILCSVTKWEGHEYYEVYDDYEEGIQFGDLTLEKAKDIAESWYKKNESRLVREAETKAEILKAIKTDRLKAKRFI